MSGLMRFARRRRVAVRVAVALVTVLTLPVVKRLRIDPDILNLLPQSGPAVRAFRTYLSVFGSFDRVYVVFEVPEGQSVDDYAPLVDRYTESCGASRKSSASTSSCSSRARTGPMSSTTCSC